MPEVSTDVPDEEWIRTHWRDRAIDSATVHIENKTGCLVAIPVAAHQLSQTLEGADPESGRTRFELTWLARLLAQETVRRLKDKGTWERLQKERKGTLKDTNVLHKFDYNNFGGEPVYVRACNSVRVAYSIVVELSLIHI